MTWKGERTIFIGALKVVKEGNWKLMQSTGLKDRNGKLIFEGDVVEYDYKEVGIARAVIVWEMGGFTTGGCNHERSGHFLNQMFEKAEIIGNRYENPELLENKELVK